jgi:hypothetical protein
MNKKGASSLQGMHRSSMRSGALSFQGLDHGQMTFFGRHTKRFIVVCMDVGAGGEQRLDHCEATFARRHTKRF